MYPQVPHRLLPNERPSVSRLVQLVLCDDDWARIDAHRVRSTLLRPACCPTPRLMHRFRSLVNLQMAYEHVYGIRLSEREAEAHIRQKVAIQQRLMPYPETAHGLDIPSNPVAFDRLVDKGGLEYPLSDQFANLSMSERDLVQRGPGTVNPLTPRASVERPRMERAPTSTSGVSVVVPREQGPAWDARETATRARKDSFATLASSSSESMIGPPSSLASQDREYKHWGRLDDPDSVWNNLHVERPRLNDRRRFSSYKEYKKIRNQPMKDNDQLFKKRMRQSFAKGEMEVLSVDGCDGTDEDVDGVGEEDEIREEVTRAEPKRHILLVKRKGNLAGQNL